ncbi:hypothetical protein [Ideonella sp.]|uniref:hypothetical protein n=1 Tax=Ideonella sp. TaxID=1929293 RepID=UPI002B463973|nr:hypothetical protein [Ideonella sp.]HJV69944.1 hypothetical protein [Ideonella sp.]
MNISTQQQAPALDTAPRILARQLARELSKEEIEAISGGRSKDQDHGGTGSGLWGNLDDSE